ncbi:hypothetical protein TIFTF001_038346 [Ficus carica]|uniref:F-box/LRR-repeat protein 15/At3g58940/PEG3-like LRR domain-containing protein n=1 Tax=Ficus carica TaxID=3494 RepID=A0AA88E8L7_FICCA|nr:hypothetical protein TIFTF001_038346 [Ficus carica]
MHTQECCIRGCLGSSFNFAVEEHHVLSWLHNAVTCNLKQLVIDVNLKRGSDFVLPSSLLSCKSLESVRMRFRNGTGILKIPPSIGDTCGFSSLKCLKMTSVCIDECFGELISSYCKSLEELSLTTLSAPKVENFAQKVENSTEPIPFFDKNLVHVLRDVAGNIKGLTLTNDSVMLWIPINRFIHLEPNFHPVVQRIWHDSCMIAAAEQTEIHFDYAWLNRIKR